LDKLCCDCIIIQAYGAIGGVIEEICEKKGITVQELRAGGRRAEVSDARREIALSLVQKYGISFAEIARNVGVTTSGIYRILERKRHEST
jgi:DNA invertase Pin-like site-specific DNA recombinase